MGDTHEGRDNSREVVTTKRKARGGIQQRLQSVYLSAPVAPLASAIGSPLPMSDPMQPGQRLSSTDHQYQRVQVSGKAHLGDTYNFGQFPLNAGEESHERLTVYRSRKPAGPLTVRNKCALQYGFPCWLQNGGSR